MNNIRIHGLQRRGIWSRVRDEAWSLGAFLCSKVLLKNKKRWESFWYRHQKGTERLRNWTSVSSTGGEFFTSWATREHRIKRRLLIWCRKRIKPSANCSLFPPAVWGPLAFLPITLSVWSFLCITGFSLFIFCWRFLNLQSSKTLTCSFLFFSVFIYFWYQSDDSFIECIWEYSLLFNFLE